MMPVVMRRHGTLFAAFALLAAPAQAAPDYFLHGYYTPVSGQVGQPLHADVSFGVDDMPANCVAVWKQMVIAGDLPPGLNIADRSSVIEGIPVTAGNFPVTVAFHGLGCTYDPNTGVDRTIRAVFHIAR
jgi:hypothetical protein